MKDFLSIKEFSQFSGIEQTTLRYWDDLGIFMPAKRDPENNYRYYTPDQIIAVNFITVLSSLNVPLKTIGEIDNERTPEKIVRLIEQQEKLLDMEMRRLRECYSIIHKRREFMNYGIKLMAGFNIVDGVRIDADESHADAIPIDVSKISVMYRDDAAAILGPRNHFDESGEFYKPFMNFCNHAEELRINLNFPIGGYHDNMESFLKAPGQPDYFFSMDPTGNVKREAGNYLIGFSLGYYGQFGDLAHRMETYAKENSITTFGPVYTMYLFDEICVKDPSQYLAQVCVAVKKK